MPSFTYNPPPGEPEVVRTLGLTFVAGEPVDIPDDHIYLGKLRANPMFGEKGVGEGQSSLVNESVIRANASLDKRLDGRTKEAREARQKAEAAAAEAEAKERAVSDMARSRDMRSEAEIRALAQQQSLEAARGEAQAEEQRKAEMEARVAQDRQRREAEAAAKPSPGAPAR